MWSSVVLLPLSPIDACSNPIYYWLGDYDEAHHRFHLATARGPFKLDLGRTLYAATLYQDIHVGGGGHSGLRRLGAGGHALY